MPHSVRDEDDDPADHTSRPSSPVGPAPTASADFANSANTASSTAQPTTTITFERLPIPPGGRNVPGESLLTALFRSAPNQGRMPTPAAPRFLPAAPRSLPPALRPIRAGRRSRAAAHCSHQGASRPPAAACKKTMRRVPDPFRSRDSVSVVPGHVQQSTNSPFSSSAPSHSPGSSPHHHQPDHHKPDGHPRCLAPRGSV